MFRIPTAPSERFELYMELCDIPNLTGQAAMWVQSYPRSDEYQALQKKAMQDLFR